MKHPPLEAEVRNRIKFSVDKLDFIVKVFFNLVDSKCKVVQFIGKIQQQKYKVENDQGGRFSEKDWMVIMDYTPSISQ